MSRAPQFDSPAPARAQIENRWDAELAVTMSPQQLLLYRSRLLGSDPRVTNFGGGNTSAKIQMVDLLTQQPVTVLWVKGSGGDLGTMELDGFSTLYQEKLLALQARYRGPQDEDSIVGLYPHCTFNLNSRAPSIDTPLHAFIDRPHVDHMHPDAVIAIAASSDGQAITHQIYGDEIGWLPWVRPGFRLGLQLQRFLRDHPRASGVILESHGLFTWGATSKETYDTTLSVINRAVEWLAERARGVPRFGGMRVTTSISAEHRRDIAAAVMPTIRGLVAREQPKLGHFDDRPEVLEFVGSEAFERLAALGTSCPDHFLRTKIRPLVLPFDVLREKPQDLLARLPAAVDKYRADYRAYYDRCHRAGSPRMRDPNAVVYLIPGIGMITFAIDKATSRIAGEFYVNAINVMREASGVSTYRGLPEQEAFDIEYWSLEEAKLQRMRRLPLAGKVAVITGGAGGIGRASAQRLLDEGACVVLCDIDREALSTAERSLQELYGRDAVTGVWVDVTDENTVAQLFTEITWRFGGVDICVSNAGIASAAAIEDTSLELWRRNIDILATGYFLISRSCVKLMKAQGFGGSIVFIGSKNALAASSGASAYCTAKASELHLARCLALEGAPAGIRVNVVNPDAVLRGSRIWQGEWAAQRAQQYNTTAEELATVYRDRSLLKRSVYPEDVAEAVAFFASERSGKSTGNIINVDSGNAQSFTR